MTQEISKSQMGFGFDVREVKLTISDVLPDYISEIVSSRKLWQSRSTRARDGVFLDLRSGKNQIFDTNTWQVRSKIEELDELTSRRDKAGLIMHIGEYKPGIFKQIEESLDTVFDVLVHSSPVIILENSRKLDEEESKMRKQLMRNVGYVQTNTVRIPEYGLVLWEGRMEKRRKPHPPIDLIHSKHKTWLEREYNSVIKILKNAGYVLDGLKEDQVIWHELQATKMPPNAISALRDGHGLKLIRTKCYVCKWEIDIRGTEIQIDSCDDKDCVGVSPLKDLEKVKGRPGNVFNLAERKTLNNNCGHCGSNLESTYRLVREDKKVSHIQEHIGCSHCMKPSLVRNHRVHPDQVVGREVIPYHQKP